ncbi:hypothetical protein CK203_077115 [Vitis vinifera]|uniref:Uncharacterized protein n=1 Tax=Vitis vinifera TaxID=29760 RepID=A0A438D5R7_VITVI|nr:hypothetical protein CK203_077115 [Vitis vinifera]
MTFNGRVQKIAKGLSRTLAIKPLPKIEEVFAEVRREETRKRVMLGPTKTTVSVPSGDNSAIPVHGVDAARGDDKVVMKDPEDIAAYQKSIERQRVHIFLAGLGGDFEQVRGEILRKDPLSIWKNAMH